jgi:branched-chain amino acid transport system ATP-binding protein
MLEVDGVRAGYGAINVLWDVSLGFPKPGKLTTIIGPNGAGKTTLLRAIMGLVPVTRARSARRAAPERHADLGDGLDHGIAMIPEGRMVFRDMSVEENLIMGAFHVASRACPRRQSRRSRTRCSRACANAAAAGRFALGRRSADAGHGARPDERSAHPADRRAVAGPGAAGGQRTVRHPRAAQHRRPHHHPGRTEHRTRHRHRGSRSISSKAAKIVLSRPAADISLDQLHELYFAR